MSFCKDVVKSFLQLVEKVIKEDVKKNKFIHFDIRPDDFLKILNKIISLLKVKIKKIKKIKKRKRRKKRKKLK